MTRTAVFLLLFLFSASSLAAPKGFILEEPAENPGTGNDKPKGFGLLEHANNITSIENIAQDGDYVLLQGRFIRKDDDRTYIFEDILGKTIEVRLDESQGHAAPMLDVSYLIFAVVRTGLFSKRLDLQNLSNPRM